MHVSILCIFTRAPDFTHMQHHFLADKSLFFGYNYNMQNMYWDSLTAPQDHCINNNNLYYHHSHYTSLLQDIRHCMQCYRASRCSQSSSCTIGHMPTFYSMCNALQILQKYAIIMALKEWKLCRSNIKTEINRQYNYDYYAYQWMLQYCPCIAHNWSVHAYNCLYPLRIQQHACLYCQLRN